MELTDELKNIFDRIKSDSTKSSSELVKAYSNEPQFIEYLEKAEMQHQKIKEELESLKQKNDVLGDEKLDDNAFLQNVVSRYVQTILVPKIVAEYGSLLSEEQISTLKNIEIEVIYDENFKHDITAYHEQGKISLNMAYLGKDNKDQTLNGKIITTLGTIPHELFHFFIKMLKQQELADERMVYNLNTGEVATNLGMVGHMINEGFVEKLSTEFCKKNSIFYSIAPSYISFVDLCSFIMNNNPQIDIQYLTTHNYEDILAFFSKDIIELYQATERFEYAQNFALKMQDGKYRNISTDEIVSSYNEVVEIQKEQPGL